MELPPALLLGLRKCIPLVQFSRIVEQATAIALLADSGGVDSLARVLGVKGLDHVSRLLNRTDMMPNVLTPAAVSKNPAVRQKLRQL